MTAHNGGWHTPLGRQRCTRCGWRRPAQRGLCGPCWRAVWLDEHQPGSTRGTVTVRDERRRAWWRRSRS